MILKAKPTSFCSILATIPAKKEIIQTSLAIIIPNMIGMAFGAGLLSSCEIETKILSASMTEFKEVLVQDRTADLTTTDLHPSQRK